MFCLAESINAFDDILVGSFAKFIELSKQIDGTLVTEQAKLVQQAVESERSLLQLATNSKKPDDATLSNLLKPTADLIAQVQVSLHFDYICLIY